MIKNTPPWELGLPGELGNCWRVQFLVGIFSPLKNGHLMMQVDELGGTRPKSNIDTKKWWALENVSPALNIGVILGPSSR